MNGIIVIAALFPIGLVAWLIWFLQPPPATSQPAAILGAAEQSKPKTTLAKIGTFFMGVLILSFAKAACHREPPVKRMTQEDAKAEALRAYLDIEAQQQARKASEKPKYPRALYGGGVSWDAEKK